MTDPTALDLLAALDASVIVGVVTADGEPFATRCWGLRVLSQDPPRIRLLIPRSAVESLGRAVGEEAPCAIAATSADVVSLVARQAKGTTTRFDEADADDLDLAERYIATFTAKITRSDGYDPDVLAGWPPPALVRCDVDVDAVFDQTPGPSAGARLPLAAG